MQKKKEPPNGNNPNRNTSYYKARVGKGKKQKKETSVFMDRAKKRQMNNYRLALFVLVSLMFAFTGIILLGAWLNSLVVPENETDITGNLYNDIFTPLITSPNAAANTNAAPVTEPPQPVDISTIFYNYNGVYLDVRQIEDLDRLQDFIDIIKSKGINAVNIDIKKEDGSVPYHINGQVDSVVGTANYIDIPIEDIINLLHKNELYVSGTIACFKDNLATAPFKNYSLKDSTVAKMVWQDPDGNCWLNAYSEGAREYIKSIVADSAKLGFDEIILSWFFFPSVANEKSVSYEDNGMTKYAAVKDFVTEQSFALNEIAPRVKLGLNIPIKYFLNMPNETMGLNPADLSDRCNFFATSFAPADIPSGTKVNGAAVLNPENKPYETVKALCGHFKYLTDSVNFRPYLQAFNGYNEDKIVNQRQALYEYDINVWQLVNYENIY